MKRYANRGGLPRLYLASLGSRVNSLEGWPQFRSSARFFATQPTRKPTLLEETEAVTEEDAAIATVKTEEAELAPTYTTQQLAELEEQFTPRMPELVQRVLHQEKGAVGVVPLTINRQDAQKIFQWQISNEFRPMTPVSLFDAINFDQAKCKLVPFWYFPCTSDVLYEGVASCAYHGYNENWGEPQAAEVKGHPFPVTLPASPAATRYAKDVSTMKKYGKRSYMLRVPRLKTLEEGEIKVDGKDIWQSGIENKTFLLIDDIRNARFERLDQSDWGTGEPPEHWDWEKEAKEEWEQELGLLGSSKDTTTALRKQESLPQQQQLPTTTTTTTTTATTLSATEKVETTQQQQEEEGPKPSDPKHKGLVLTKSLRRWIEGKGERRVLTNVRRYPTHLTADNPDFYPTLNDLAQDEGEQILENEYMQNLELAEEVWSGQQGKEQLKDTMEAELKKIILLKEVAKYYERPAEYKGELMPFFYKSAMGVHMTARVEAFHVNRIERDCRLLMVPFYELNYKWGRKNYKVLMNAHTGHISHVETPRTYAYLTGSALLFVVSLLTIVPLELFVPFLPI